MSVEEPDEDEPPGPPPHPLDRVWFHPSEVGAALAAWREARAPRRRDWGLVALVAFVSVGVVVGVLAAVGAFAGGSRNSARGGVAPPPVPAASSVSDIVNAVAPSVVAVRAVGPAGETQASGVAMDGTRVLTSSSVLASATAITVTSATGRLAPAKVLGADPETDLTLLSVDGGNLPGARIGNSDGLQVGDAVVALGLSAGEHRVAGVGIVSALHKVSSLPGGQVLAGQLETDVRMSTAASGTASGGALVDSGGLVVGINSAGLPGQAVPISIAHDVVEQIEASASGRVRHGWLGVSVVDARDRSGGGAQVTAVTPNSPAASAGLVAGDVVTAVVADGTTEHVTDAGDLVAAVEGLRYGDPATITAARGGGRLTRQVSLGERPAGGMSFAGLAA
jgi:putative serine protease PepD